MRLHLDRQIKCKAKIRNINLDDYRDKILNGDKNIDIEPYPILSQSIPNHPISSQNIPKHTIFSDTEKEYECEYCERKYKHKYHLNRHLKTCKEKKEHDEETAKTYDLIEKLNEQLRIQEEKIEALEKERSTNINNSNNTNTNSNNNIQVNNNNTINVNLNRLNYKNTDYDGISDKEIKHAISMTNQCVQAMFELTHFNKKYPRNQNVYVSNLKSGIVMMFEGKRWNAKHWNKIADKIIHDNSMTIYEWLEFNKKEYPELAERYDIYEKNRQKDGFIKDQKQDMYTSMYNNRGLIFSEETVKMLQNIDTNTENN
tara:strand:- start:4036 stop:4977 length:942 start_codon:yes stop_codon:yes gene_type:complete